MWHHRTRSILLQGKTSHFDGLVQERCNSSALALELHLFCTNPLICKQHSVKIQSKYIEKGMHLKMSAKCWSLLQGKASHFDGLVQERCNSSALAMVLHLCCTNPLICKQHSVKIQSKYIEKGMGLKCLQNVGHIFQAQFVN